MAYEISVATPFADISELAESFASRVDEERLMLPNTDGVPEGEWVQFAVLLGDGAAALSGMGRCSGSYDNGEDRAPEHRFDIVLDSLQLDEMAQVYFERILMVRQQQSGAEPTTGEVELPEESAFEPPSSEMEPVSAQEFVESDEEPAPPPAAPPPRAPARPSYPASPPTPRGELPSPHSNPNVLLRPMLTASWSPEPMPRPDARPSSGLFQYATATLPLPSEPPRPEIHPSLRVKPAPRPGDPVEVPFAPQTGEYSVEMADADEDQY